MNARETVPSPAGRRPFVDLRGVSLTLASGASLVRDITLAVPEGQTTVLLGRSGSGKTTVLRLINAIAMPTAGEVVVAGRSTADWDPIELRRRTGYVIQEGGLLPHYTVERNVGLVPSLLGWPPDRIRARVRELLSLVSLDPDEFSARFPHELSGGQRQRVGIARALAADPPLLLCDEPFGALDPITRAEMQREFRALERRLGKTIVFVTHDLREAVALAAHVALLDRGTVAVSGPPDAVLASDHPEARAFARTLEPVEEAAP
ncbi:MAG: ATP-binding cassette domain-containing protein [Deltaproteobacteria bacterium]|nr:MAG: ATP-binding cassette domain-containing protein [Deltaproteobacteria bacterium]